MKKLFFLLIVVAASVLPQSVWAVPTTNEAILDGTTLTIRSIEPGNLANGTVSLSHVTNKASVTKIILEGLFNESDLIAIKGRVVEGESDQNGEFLGVTEVDMTEAQFVQTASGVVSQASYSFYSTTANRDAVSASTGDRCIVGGTLYKSAQNGHWVEVSVPNEGTTVVANIDPSSTTGYAIGTYGRPAAGTAKYVQMNITYSWSTGHSIPVPESATDLTNGGTEDRARNYVTSSVAASSYPEQNVWIYYYYKSSNDGGSWHWVEATRDEYEAVIEGSTHYDNPTDADINALQNNYAGENRYMRVKVYFTSQATRAWTNDTESEPSTYTNMSAYEYAYRDNHKTGYTNGEWVKLTAWQYYQFQATNTGTGWHWEQVNYTEGESHYIDKKYGAGTNPNDDTTMPTRDNQWAVVLGSEFYYINGNWGDPASVTNIPHYVDMKFSYWSSTLTKATTSKYANDDINPDIFLNCKILSTVDFKAGVLKGFENHSAANGYTASLSVIVGKDVTRIASSAFKDCDKLTTITFDKDYSEEPYSTNAYPEVLTIGENAFLNCTNLTGITIPNRVALIGNTAFHNAGNNVDEFSVTFERRYYSDKTEAEGDYTEGKDFDVPLTISSGAFEDCKKLKTLSLPVRLTSLGSRAFANTENLQTLTMRENTSHDLQDMTNGNAAYNALQTIPSGAFAGSHVTEVTIPKSVTLIEQGAFQQTNYLSKLTLQADDTDNQPALVIKEGAFAGGNEQIQPVMDVYVNIDPAKRKIICEYNAFTFTQLVGQTNEGSKQFGKLHFDDAYWDYYQGDWKRGLAFRQDNLNAFKDGYNGKWGGIETESNCLGKVDGSIGDDGKYHDGDATHDRLIAPANGWQQFAMSSTDIDIIIPLGSFMRTFSTDSAYVIPTFAQNETGAGFTVKAGDPMFDIYRITAFSDGFITSGENKSDPKNVTQAQNATREATAMRVNIADRNGRKYIPKKSGLMMVGKITANYLVYFAKADFNSTTGSNPSATEITYPFNICTYNATSATDSLTNLLYPTCIKNQNYDGTFTEGDPNETAPKYLTGAPVATINASGDSIVTLNSTIPYPYYDAEDVQFRLFGYSPSSNKFIRTRGAWSTRDKAYLKLPASLFHWACEYNGDANSGSSSGVQDPTAAAAASREVMLNFIDEEEEESGTTGIKQVDTTMQRTDSNVFYTLEGVKLTSRPTQRGIYIHNGRKVVIK